MMRYLETMGDLANYLQEIGLPLSIRYSVADKEWVATIEWAHPDFTGARACGRGKTWIAAMIACLVDYERQNPTKQ